MTPENELRLSFYKETAVLNEAHRVFLVQHVETGRFYVKKTVEQYDLGIYKAIQDNRFKGIPTIHELVETENGLVLIEEYISGKTLQSLMEQGSLPESTACRIIEDLCEILTPLHMHVPPIVHRDIKGSNLMIDEWGQLYLLDFDASKVVESGKTQDTILMGTEEYAAPEQYGFAPSDTRTDIYALGVLLNKMLTGVFPKEQLPEGPLGEIVKKCTAWEPDKRYKTVIALKRALKNREKGPIRVFWFGMPGIRSGKPVIAALWWILLAVLFYITLTAEYVHTGTDVPYEGGELWGMRIGSLLSFGLTIFYLSNYLGWRDRFPYRKRANVPAEIIRILLGAIILLLVPLLLMP